MSIRLMFVLFMSVFSKSIFAQSIFFETNFGNGIQDNARSVRELPDGTIYVAGYSDAGTNGSVDFTLTKLNKYGTPLWTHYYGDSLMNNCLYMTTTADSNFVLIGETETDSTGLDILLYKIDTTGKVMIKKQFSIKGNQSGKHILTYSDGGFVISGFNTDSSGTNNFYVIKTDSAGVIQWSTSLGSMDNDYVQMSKETPEGDILIVGDRKKPATQDYDLGLYKLSSSGNLIWEHTYGDTLNNGSQGVLITSKNKYLIYGESEIFKSSPFDFTLELVDTNGTSIWKKAFGGTISDAIFSATETTDGGFICTGYSSSYSPGLDLVVLKTDSSGNLLWVHPYGSNGIDIGYDIIPSIYGGFLIAGITSPEDGDFYLLHLDTAGIISNIPEHKSTQIITYPNPSTGIFYIQMPDHSFDNQIEVFDLYGKLVIKKWSHSPIANLDLTNQVNGLYIYKVTGKNGEVIAGKIAIQH